MPDELSIPFSEIPKSIPGFFGIRLEEEPAYEKVELIGDIEIRAYRPALMATITVRGRHDEALDQAFDRLARCVFGANDPGEQLPMTNPVTLRKGKVLPMTTPVTQAEEAGAWTVSFFLSNDLRKEDAPAPRDEDIELVEAPARLAGVLRYSGTNDGEDREKARLRLLEGLRRQDCYRVDGDLMWAQYDAPFVIPFLRRNEAQVALSHS